MLYGVRKNQIGSEPVDDSIRLWKSAVKEGVKGVDRSEYRRTGHYAWWVGDESLKARVSLGFGQIESWLDKPPPKTDFELKSQLHLPLHSITDLRVLLGLRIYTTLKINLEAIPTLSGLIAREKIK